MLREMQLWVAGMTDGDYHSAEIPASSISISITVILEFSTDNRDPGLNARQIREVSPTG